MTTSCDVGPRGLSTTRTPSVAVIGASDVLEGFADDEVAGFVEGDRHVRAGRAAVAAAAEGEGDLGDVDVAAGAEADLDDRVEGAVGAGLGFALPEEGGDLDAF